MSVIYPRMAVIGCGLIGSSVIRAARESGAVGHVFVADASEAHRQRIVELGYADEVTGDISEAVKDADLVVLAVPVLAMGEAAKAAAPALKAGATVTDVGSVKGAVVAAVGPHMPEGVHFIPGHPLAGTEHSGPGAGFAQLFDNRWCLLTPPPGADPVAVAELTAFSARQRSVWAVSRLAASAAARAAVERLKGPRTRSSASMTWAGP